jgi:hypothetical protein
MFNNFIISFAKTTTYLYITRFGHYRARKNNSKITFMFNIINFSALSGNYTIYIQENAQKLQYTVLYLKNYV